MVIYLEPVPYISQNKQKIRTKQKVTRFLVKICPQSQVAIIQSRQLKYKRKLATHNPTSIERKNMNMGLPKINVFNRSSKSLNHTQIEFEKKD